MSVDQISVVDVVSLNEAGEVILTISDHLPWDEKNEHLLILQEKINRYLVFVESGEICAKFPESKAKKVIVSVVALYPPTEAANQFLIQVGQIVEAAGLGFEFRQKHFNSPV
jgi:hypothetical protein